MTTLKQLYSLQELDLLLDDLASKQSEAESELNARLAMEKLESSLAAEQERLREIQNAHRTEQLEAETLRERSQHLESRLYDNASTNPRELEPLQLEASNIRRQVEQRDVRLLELSLQAEDSRNRCKSLEKELSETQTSWETRRAELTSQVEQLQTERAKLSSARAKMSATVDPRELQRYEVLRKTKGGRAIAKVERGLCQACRMSLPSQHLQRVRSGRQTVLCNSCGRILCAV